jgi:hypothetical protein
MSGPALRWVNPSIHSVALRRGACPKIKDLGAPYISAVSPSA